MDIAGLNDTGGWQIELINRLMLKNLLARSKSVRILLPITYNQLHTSRGASLRAHLHTLCTMLPGSTPLSAFEPAVQPVMTKCSTSVPDFDIDIERDTLLS